MSLDDRDWYREDFKRRSQLPDIKKHRRKARPTAFSSKPIPAYRRLGFLHLALFAVALCYLIYEFA